MSRPPASIDEYMSAIPADSRLELQKIRDLITRTIPEATETISYGMPAFRLKRTVVCFAAFTKHIGIYPPVSGDAGLMRDLEPYLGPKGNLKFPLNQPMPLDLIRRVVEALANSARASR